MEVTLGGERLGSGNKQKVHMHNYERSTHDLSYIWRSTMASGTLVPFMTEVALPGDTFDINLNCDVLTHPTIGPLFGTYKIQLDVFQIPIRLYNAELHMNMLGIGRDMSKVLLPQLLLTAHPPALGKPIDNQQINPSCIFSYLGMRGLGINGPNPTFPTFRQFNAIPFLGYWDIYKNYYANKQEEIGAVIHKRLDPDPISFTSARIPIALPPITLDVVAPSTFAETLLVEGSYIEITGANFTNDTDISQIFVEMNDPDTGVVTVVQLSSIFQEFQILADTNVIVGSKPFGLYKIKAWGYGLISSNQEVTPENYDSEPNILTFPCTLR